MSNTECFVISRQNNECQNIIYSITELFRFFPFYYPCYYHYEMHDLYRIVNMKWWCRISLMLILTVICCMFFNTHKVNICLCRCSTCCLNPDRRFLHCAVSGQSCNSIWWYQKHMVFHFLFPINQSMYFSLFTNIVNLGFGHMWMTAPYVLANMQILALTLMVVERNGR